MIDPKSEDEINNSDHWINYINSWTQEIRPTIILTGNCEIKTDIASKIQLNLKTPVYNFQVHINLQKFPL